VLRHFRESSVVLRPQMMNEEDEVYGVPDDTLLDDLFVQLTPEEIDR
jgi:hypothetical protein